MKYSIETIRCGAYQENAYLLCPEGTRDALLIDPGDDLHLLERAISGAGRMLRAILLTHGHFDHTLAAQPLSRITGAPVYIHEGDMDMLCNEAKNAYSAACSSLPSPVDLLAEPLEDSVDAAGVHFEVLHTPGHSRGSVCYYDRENAVLFSGDALFCAGFGRMDLFGGSPSDMRQSLRRLFALPDATKVYCGHGSDTTIAVERRRYHL